MGNAKKMSFDPLALQLAAALVCETARSAIEMKAASHACDAAFLLHAIIFTHP